MLRKSFSYGNIIHITAYSSDFFLPEYFQNTQINHISGMKNYIYIAEMFNDAPSICLLYFENRLFSHAFGFKATMDCSGLSG